MAVKGGAMDEIHELRRQLLLEHQHNEALREIIAEFTPANAWMARIDAVMGSSQTVSENPPTGAIK